MHFASQLHDSGEERNVQNWQSIFQSSFLKTHLWISAKTHISESNGCSVVVVAVDTVGEVCVCVYMSVHVCTWVYTCMCVHAHMLCNGCVLPFGEIALKTVHRFYYYCHIHSRTGWWSPTIWKCTVTNAFHRVRGLCAWPFKTNKSPTTCRLWRIYLHFWRADQPINVFFYICSHRGDTRQKNNTHMLLY